MFVLIVSAGYSYNMKYCIACSDKSVLILVGVCR